MNDTEYLKYLIEKEERDRPLKEAPLTEALFNSYAITDIKLEELEGNYIEDYGRKEAEISLDTSSWAINDLQRTGKPLPGIDPRTGAYGQVFASLGFYFAGIEYRNRGDSEKSIANFTKAVEINPRNIYAYYERGIARGRLGDHKGALDDLWDAVDLNPVRLAERNEQSRALLEMRERREIEGLTFFLADTLHARGVVYYQDDDLDDALLDFDKAISYNPDLTEAYVHRSCVNLRFSDFKKVVSDCAFVLGVQPERAGMYSMRGQAYANLGKYEEAIADLDKAVSMGLKSIAHHLNRAYCYYKLNDLEKAFADIETAVQMESDSIDALYQRGGMYYETGQTEKALADYREVVRLENIIEAETLAAGEYYDELCGCRASALHFIQKLETGSK